MLFLLFYSTIRIIYFNALNKNIYIEIIEVILNLKANYQNYESYNL